jgi:hypothetical protein
MKSFSLLAVASALSLASADPKVYEQLKKRQSNMIGNLMGSFLNRKFSLINLAHADSTSRHGKGL